MRITKVYTRKGDDGTTGLVGGHRVAKHDGRIEAYGAVDEASSAMGLARAELQHSMDRFADRGDVLLLDRHLEYLQQQLFVLGADLATRPDDRWEGMDRLDARAVTRIEAVIDAYSAHLPPLEDFVLPTGTGAVAALHMARCVARRAERTAVTLDRAEALDGHEIAYLNRLSDLLFVLARWVAAASGAPEVIWCRDLEPPPPPDEGGGPVKLTGRGPRRA